MWLMPGLRSGAFWWFVLHKATYQDTASVLLKSTWEIKIEITLEFSFSCLPAFQRLYNLQSSLIFFKLPSPPCCKLRYLLFMPSLILLYPFLPSIHFHLASMYILADLIPSFVSIWSLCVAFTTVRFAANLGICAHTLAHLSLWDV